MTRSKVFGLCASAVAIVAFAAACSSPAASPTQAPAKPAEPTKAAAPAAQPTAAAAQPTAAPAAPKVAFPEKGKNVQMIVPFGAGGSTDVGARLLAPGMEKALGTPVQVVNKAGAGSQTGVTEIAKSKADGYTIGFSNLPNTNLIMADPERKAAFGPKDFIYLGAQVLDPSAIAVKADGPYKSMKDLIDAAKAKPDTIKLGSDGPMTDDHLGIFQLEQAAGVKLVNVGFDGAASANTALMGGHIDGSFGHVGDFIAGVKSGQIRVIAIADESQSKYYPGVPTLKELGYNVTNSSTRTLVVPAGTPADVVKALSDAMKKAWDDADHQKKMEEAGLTLRWMDGAQTQAYSDEMDKRAKVLVEAARKK